MPAATARSSARLLLRPLFAIHVTFPIAKDNIHNGTLEADMHTIQAIYQRHAPALHRFALGLCGDVCLAKDLVAETFMRAMVSSTPIDTTTVLAYLCTIARRLYLKEWHRRQRHSELDDVHVDSAPGPEKQAMDAQAFGKILAALQALPEIDRAALLMRAEDGIPYEDIAHALNISLSTAKVKVFRARLRLSHLLNEESR